MKNIKQRVDRQHEKEGKLQRSYKKCLLYTFVAYTLIFFIVVVVFKELYSNFSVKEQKTSVSSQSQQVQTEELSLPMNFE